MFPVLSCQQPSYSQHVPKKHTRTELPEQMFRRAWLNTIQLWAGVRTVEGVEVHIVPGNHLTMLRKPNVQALAEH